MNEPQYPETFVNRVALLYFVLGLLTGGGIVGAWLR